LQVPTNSELSTAARKKTAKKPVFVAKKEIAQCARHCAIIAPKSVQKKTAGYAVLLADDELD